MASQNETPNGRGAPEKFIRQHLGEDALDDGGDESEGDDRWQEFY